MKKFFKEDVERYRAEYSFINLVKLLVNHPGFKTIFRIRMMHFTNKFSPFVASLMRLNLVKKFGCDVMPGSKIGPGLLIQHPVGIVIGLKVIIGKNCTIAGNCTIGEKYIDQRSTGDYPVIGDNVSLGANSIILGKIAIGDNVTVGANSVVLKDVTFGETVMGVFK